MLYLYRKAFEDWEMGYASAMAWFLFAIILAFTLVILKSTPLWVHYEGETQ
jgi:multiple sugar transport system permease protein